MKVEREKEKTSREEMDRESEIGIETEREP